MRAELPDFKDWSVAAVWLLRGVVYADDEKTWNVVLSNQTTLESYFARLGLRLVVDERENMAYLRQLFEEEAQGSYADLPKLFRASPLTYAQTMLCVLLRDELRRFEDEDLRNERCVVEEVALLDQWRHFFPKALDDVRLQRDLSAAMRKLEEFGFVKQFGDTPSSWEIRRILKARLPAPELERLKQSLIDSVTATDAANATGLSTS